MERVTILIKNRMQGKIGPREQIRGHSTFQDLSAGVRGADA